MSDCSTNKSDLGVRTCKSTMDIARRLILVPEFDSTGAQNKITLADAKTLVAWTAKFDAGDTLDRFYPTPEMENVEDTRAESTFQEFNSGKKAFISKGQRSFKGFMVREGTIFLGQLEDWENVTSFGIYYVDKVGNIIYKKCPTSTDLKPILVDNVSFEATLVKKNDAEVEMIQLDFDIRITEKDSDLRVLEASDLDFDANEDIFALLDVTSTYTDISTINVTVTLLDLYGDPVPNMVIGDFDLFNITDTATVVITSVTETSEGVYVFLFPLETSADILRLTPTKTGFDFSAVVTNLITIP